MQTVAHKFSPGDLVTWHGWDAIVVDVDLERKYAYRIEIVEFFGHNFTVLALPGEVTKRSIFSRVYTSQLAIAVCQVEAEDEQRKRRENSEAETQWHLETLRAALTQTERELRWMQSWWWVSLTAVSLAGFILGFMARR